MEGLVNLCAYDVSVTNAEGVVVATYAHAETTATQPLHLVKHAVPCGTLNGVVPVYHPPRVTGLSYEPRPGSTILVPPDVAQYMERSGRYHNVAVYAFEEGRLVRYV